MLIAFACGIHAVRHMAHSVHKMFMITMFLNVCTLIIFILQAVSSNSYILLGGYIILCLIFIYLFFKGHRFLSVTKGKINPDIKELINFLEAHALKEILLEYEEDTDEFTDNSEVTSTSV